ncbi:MAG TPA: FMN-binding protein [Candidatus Limnocylindrales bacterium]
MFPKRGAIAIVLTALALVLLVSFKTPDDFGRLGNGRTAGIVAPGPSGAPGATAAPSAGDGGALGATGPTPRPSAGRPSAAPTAAAATGQVTGTVVETRFGPVQVRATFQNGRIMDVQAVQLPSDRARSAQISQYAEPYLRSEALQAQSAQIDIVSGATYTSEGYARSLQSAIDQAQHQ